jgi:hypothetical protein
MKSSPPFSSKIAGKIFSTHGAMQLRSLRAAPSVLKLKLSSQLTAGVTIGVFCLQGFIFWVVFLLIWIAQKLHPFIDLLSKVANLINSSSYCEKTKDLGKENK